MPRNTSIFLGMPTRGNPEAGAIVRAQEAAAKAANGQRHKVVMQMEHAEPATVARNKLVRMFLESDAMYLLFVDDDTLIPSNTIADLLAADADIASGITPFQYKGGVSGLRGNVYKTNTDSNDGDYWVDLWPDGVFDAMQCGTSCVLIKRKVFETLPFPWFVYKQTEEGRMMTEDVYFTRGAHAAGLSIKGVGSVRCGHVKKVNLVDFCPPAYPEKVDDEQHDESV